MTSTPSLRNLKSPASERSNKSDTLEAESSVPALENDKKDQREHRKGKRAFTTFVWNQDYKTLKRIAFEQDTNIQALIDEALGLLFKKRGGYEKVSRKAPAKEKQGKEVAG